MYTKVNVYSTPANLLVKKEEKETDKHVDTNPMANEHAV